MSEPQSIQWFPGHMTKTRRRITEQLKAVDAVAEIIDARIPASSRNPDLAGIVVNKPGLILMNKSDISDPAANKIWSDFFRSDGKKVLTVDCRSGKGLGGFVPAVKEILSEKIERNRRRGMPGKMLRVMVVGVPNCGKSSFINRMARSAKTKVGDRPGVTRGEQWVSIGGGVELLDTAGVLWPKFDDMTVGEKLAFTGAVKDDITDSVHLAARLIEKLNERYGSLVNERYKLGQESEGLSSLEILELIAKKRSMLMSGGVADIERAANVVIDEFRAGKIGRITLELPDEFEV